MVPDERLILAIGRLERALTRVEAITPHPPGDEEDASGLAGHGDLARRHDSLRARTAEAIVRLDALIGDAAIDDAAARS